jgi:sugar phosphate isomerase/epimerase
MIGISSSWPATKELSIKDSVEYIFKLGFDLVEIGAAHKYEDNAVETVLKLRNKYPMKSFTLHALFPPGKNGSLYPLNLSDTKEHDRILKTVKNMFDISERLGCNFVGIHGGFAGRVKWVKGKFGFRELKVEKPIDIEDAKTNMKIILEDLVHVAEEKNMKLAVEIYFPHESKPLMTNPEMFKWMFSLFKNSHLGLLLDIGHLHVAGIRGDYDPYKFVKKFKDRILELHIHDYNGERDHVAAGSGNIDFKKYFKIIGKDRVEKLPLVFEYNNAVNEKQVLEGKKFIESVIERLN